LADDVADARSIESLAGEDRGRRIQQGLAQLVLRGRLWRPAGLAVDLVGLPIGSVVSPDGHRLHRPRE
jgi:hypothetical protein